MRSYIKWAIGFWVRVFVMRSRQGPALLSAGQRWALTTRTEASPTNCNVPRDQRAIPSRTTRTNYAHDQKPPQDSTNTTPLPLPYVSIASYIKDPCLNSSYLQRMPLPRLSISSNRSRPSSDFFKLFVTLLRFHDWCWGSSKLRTAGHSWHQLPADRHLSLSSNGDSDTPLRNVQCLRGFFRNGSRSLLCVRIISVLILIWGGIFVQFLAQSESLLI